MNGLASLPPGLAETAALIDRLDDALRHGFARLGDDHRAALGDLIGVFDGSPLGQALGEAVAAVGRGEFVTQHFLVLAASRVALHGAMYDALMAQVHAALGRSPIVVEEPPARPPGGASAMLAGTQQWLMELAIAGFQHVEESTVAPFSATLGPLQAEPELTGLAALLTGFVDELLRHVPTRRHPALPVYRWSDLWTASMIRTQHTPGPPTFREARGTLVPLGLDVQSHDHFACALLYGAFEDDQGVRTVRVPFSSYKVDLITGPEIWDVFGPNAGPIPSALAQHKTLGIEQAELRSNGDLILRAPPKLGGTADPFAVADRLTALPACPALFRHPVHIAEVARLPGDHGLPLASERTPGREFPKSPDELIGLLRFDRGGWRVQPLCLRSKKVFEIVGEELAQARIKLKNRSLDTLRERASRLLRVKS